MLGIKTGQKLYQKGSDKSNVKVVSEETMELELQEGKTKKRFAGLVKTEQYLRSAAGTPKKRCDGWDYFGIMDEEKKWKSIQKIYSEMDRETLIENSK